ncbi:MAG TPA: transposase [Acetobacteraceae bacterium]|jgi:putative transposase|nr:transposase [Acetobacteraceae bacterium]
MGLWRSTFDDTTLAVLDADGILARIGAICDAFEWYGYRRVGAALRQQGVVVNGKQLRRLMREHDLQRSGDDAMLSPSTATMPGRFIPTWPRTSFPVARTSCGSRT